MQKEVSIRRIIVVQALETSGRSRKLSKATIQDVAKTAGVSVATVDRALHGRGGVSQTSLKRISDAIQSLGFGEYTKELTKQMRPQIKLRFIIPSGAGGFILMLKNALISAAAKTNDVQIDIEFNEITIESPDIVRALQKAKQDQVSAVGLFTMDTVEVRNAIDANVEAGMPVVTMVSDVPAAHRATFVGIDNNAAGRTAGRLMGKFLRNETGKVAVITGSMKVRDHLERFFAFRDVLSRDFRNITVLPVLETRSLDRFNLECVKNLLETHDDLLGIYLVTGGVAGVLAGLRERPHSERPVFIAHDLTSTTKRALISGEIDAVINQDPEEIAETTLRFLLGKLIKDRSFGNYAKGSIGIGIYLSDNLP